MTTWLRRAKRLVYRLAVRPVFMLVAQILHQFAAWYDGNDEAFLNGMEERIYADVYAELCDKDQGKRIRLMNRRRDLVLDFLGPERTDRLLARLERRIQWEQAMRAGGDAERERQAWLKVVNPKKGNENT
jgi:hypothetical protein